MRETVISFIPRLIYASNNGEFEDAFEARSSSLYGQTVTRRPAPGEALPPAFLERSDPARTNERASSSVPLLAILAFLIDDGVRSVRRRTSPMQALRTIARAGGGY
ncbi:hypothetical protein AXG93_4123s1210 [Marchantia polymorpha subsp. ruderalis]|uniref:Uncharacterized protein n=1 Tax=Marchantia polymorpha subsp. ruderalis TaxID=1480154 RepID=A0A176WM70_MARPO|nr:hypothetical protein AXG93_4123s1210 [Marchantia polymorpha subsp. ruderalis]